MRQRVATEAGFVGEPLREAFEEHYGRLVRLCFLLTGERDAAEDVAQEAFVRLATKIDRLEPGAVGPYVRRIAVNLWKNRLRRMALELRHRREAPPPGDRIAFEDRDELWTVVKRLPPRQRACVVLRYYEDLSERDAAITLGCSIGAVKSQTSKALARLRKELAHVD
jgi:RNA polymerase sigma-70 factor (sigma-E family)